MSETQSAVRMPIVVRDTVALSAHGRSQLRITDGIARVDGRELVRDAVAGAVLEGAIWIVARDAQQDWLHRFDDRGDSVGTPEPLGTLGTEVALAASRRGQRWILVEGDRVVSVRESGRELTVEDLGGATRDRRVLLAGRGIFERQGNTLSPRGRNVCGLVLPADLSAARVVSGALVLDGAAAVTELEHRGTRHMLVFGARGGELRTRIRIGDATLLALAEIRGIAAIGRDRHVALLDLRTGRCPHERIFPVAIVGMSMSANADRLVILDERGHITDLATGLADIGGGSTAVVCHEEEKLEPIDDEPVVEVPLTAVDAPSTASAPPPPAAAPLDSAPLLGLVPRAVRALLADDVLRAHLDDAFELIAAWVQTAATVSHDATVELTAARVREREAASRMQQWDGIPTPLAELAAELGLSPLARAVLLAVAAPQLWGELARGYAAINEDPTRPLVDEMLVCQLLEVGRARRTDVARELDLLTRAGLVAVGKGARPFAALEVPHAAAQRLAGVIDRSACRSSDRPLDELLVPRERVAALLAELARPPVDGPVRVVLRGKLGSGLRTLAAALAARANRSLELVTFAVGPIDEALARLRADLRDARLRGSIACVYGYEHAAAADATVREQLRAVLDAHPSPLFARCGAESLAPFSPGHLTFELPSPSLGEQRDAWMAAFARHGLPTAHAANLAGRYRVGAATAHRIAAQVAAGGEPARAGDLVDRALRQRRIERLGRLATRVDRLASWQELVLADDMVDSIRELVARVRLRSTVLDSWGMDRVASTGRAVTALFQGGPGTGKTLVAGVVARELGFDLYRADISRVTSRWIGETEKNLSELFDAAEDGQCILLFDEADSLFGKRTEVRSSNDRHANLEVNYLLQRLDSFEGVAILTTNFGTAIDAAFRRRLSVHLQFPFPDETERERLWRAHLPATVPVAGDLDLATLAHKYTISGGYIRNAALRAVYLAAGEGSSLTAAHLRRAVAAEYRDKSKIAATGTLE